MNIPDRDRKTPVGYAKKAAFVLRHEGVRTFSAKGLRKIAKKIEKPPTVQTTEKVKGIAFNSLVDRVDVMRADWVGGSKKPSKTKRQPLKVTNWIISPPSGGGGHQNMFRFIEHLDRNGYTNNIYLYTRLDPMSISEATTNVAAYANLSNTHFFHYDRDQKLADSDALFATGWETAYPVYNEKTKAKKFYFVQDFEPLFYPMGTEYLLAENTYKFGFHGITAGRWLANKLNDDYGMTCNSYDFGAHKDLYRLTNNGERKEVFCYARPVTERRAFDLAIMALEVFHKKHPEYVINLAGWDVTAYSIPFPHVNHKSLKLEELSDLYNKCATGLVLSLTNMSLLPLELLAAGCIPVMNDGDNNRMVSDNPYISYTEPSPVALAAKMSEVVERDNSPAYAKKAAGSVEDASWDKAKQDFLSAVEQEIYA